MEKSKTPNFTLEFMVTGYSHCMMHPFSNYARALIKKKLTNTDAKLFKDYFIRQFLFNQAGAMLRKTVQYTDEKPIRCHVSLSPEKAHNISSMNN